MRISTISILAIAMTLAAPALAEPPDLTATLTAMAQGDAQAYVAGRDSLLARGDVDLPGLEQLGAETSSWRVRAAAQACAGWSQHADLYTEFSAARPGITAAGTLRYRPSASHDERLTPLLVEMLVWTRSDAAQRVAVADMLMRLRDPRATGALVWIVTDDDAPTVRLTAVDALARTQDATATAHLAAALTSVEDADIRVSVAGALGWRKDVAAVPALLTALTGDEHAPLRAQAAQSLGWLRQPATAGPLIGTLAGDPDADVRGAAALALGKVGGEAARLALEQAATSDPDPEVVRLAGVALGRLQ